MKYYIEVLFVNGVYKKFLARQELMTYAEGLFARRMAEGRIKFFKIYPAA